MKTLYELKPFLDQKVKEFNTIDFIDNDPISIPHLFSKPEDIEISGFLTAMISWGQRPVILKNAAKLMSAMEYAPQEFILHAKPADIKIFRSFMHRTFNGDDAVYFLKSLQNLYR